MIDEAEAGSNKVMVDERKVDTGDRWSAGSRSWHSDLTLNDTSATRFTRESYHWQ